MKTKYAGLVLGLGLLGVCANLGRAAAQVGDDFKVEFKAVDGSMVSTDALKGKLLVVDFWATWCGPCMGMVPHMVEMNEKYSAKGLQIIGISLDQDRSAMLQVTKEKGMTWPEYFDGQGWGNKFWKQYGASGIPFTVLVSPAGKVLYAGHPAGGLDGAIEKAFKETPPQLVDPKVLAAATSMLDEVEQKTKAGDTKAALKLLAKVPPSASADGAFAARATAVAKKLETTANAMLAQVQTQIDKGEYIDAAARLKELSNALSGSSVGTKATVMLSGLMSNPKAKAAIAAAERNAKANDALAVAEKLQTQKKDELAYARFSEVARVFPGTDAAAKAQEQVGLYEKDAAFVQRVNEKAASAKANAALHMGDSYKAAGNLDMARKKYQSVIDDFPHTSFAETAQRLLSELASQ